MRNHLKIFCFCEIIRKQKYMEHLTTNNCITLETICEMLIM